MVSPFHLVNIAHHVNEGLDECHCIKTQDGYYNVDPSPPGLRRHRSNNPRAKQNAHDVKANVIGIFLQG
jgi:hypothetical protein